MIIRSQKLSLFALLLSVRGTIIPAIWKKVLFTVVVSSAVVATQPYISDYHLALSATPFTLWGLTLAIFLAFRNTTAYERYWEARTLWGELVVVARNLTRQILVWMPQLPRAERLALLQALIAVAYSLKDQLRQQAPSPELVALSGGRKGSTEQHHLYFAQALNRHGREQGVSDILLAQLDEQCSRLAGVQAGCERIKNTPIPYSYILMLHRTVHVYCFLLPFSLAASLGWFTPFVVLLLAYTFFGLDALGDQIADPFDDEANDLPLNALCRTIEISVLSMADEPTPPPIAAINDVLM